jgi:DNA recombination protein RmuC
LLEYFRTFAKTFLPMPTTVIFLIVFLLVALLIVGIANMLVLLRTSKGGSEDMVAKISKIDADLSRIEPLLREEFRGNRDENLSAFKANREELNNAFKLLGEQLKGSVGDLSTAQKNQLDIYSKQLAELTKSFDEKNGQLQQQLEKSAKENRAEQAASLKSFEEKFSLGMKDFNEQQRLHFSAFAERQESAKKEAEKRLSEIRETVEKRLVSLQDDNNKKLEEMRKTVDEKLQESVEKRFNESFKLISERLDAVHKGLGEMQNLAVGVGDLKKVLTNVKARGTFGEVQLGAILEQFLSPEQYVKNDHPNDEESRKVVEFSIKLPGKNSDGEPLLLPVDSKFPVEDYQRLTDAYDTNPEGVEQLGKEFENAVKRCARDIRDKYIKPPKTTDFAILFVPTEGLYAEVLRRPGFFEMLQHDYRVTVVGPTNLVAFLSSLQMGFRTLAIEKRSSEVWTILGAVKTEFGKFGDVLEKTKLNLQRATTNIEDLVGTRTRVMMSKLKNVHELQPTEAATLLGNENVVEVEEAVEI